MSAASFAAAASPAMCGAALRPSAAAARSASSKTKSTTSGAGGRKSNNVVAATSSSDLATTPRRQRLSSLSSRSLRRGGSSVCAAATAAATDAPAAATQAEFDALFAWLTASGVDTSGAEPRLVDDKPGGRGWGLVAAKDMSANETALSVPKSLWMTYETAMASPVGRFCEGQAPWVALALQLLHERSLGAKSKWAAYVATLPQQLDAPLFWTSQQLAELEATQLLQNAAGYDSYVRGTYGALFGEGGSIVSATGSDAVFDAAKMAFFSEQAFLWAFGILRSRALPPVDQGDAIALVPGLDLANHSGLSSATWQLNNGGLLQGAWGAVGRQTVGPSLVLRTEQKGGVVSKGTELFTNYGPAKIDSQFVLDFGFADEFCARPGYVLGPLSIPESDVNAFDKVDILDVAGLMETPSFTIRAFEDPPPELRVFMRLLNCKDKDTFLLEAIFRKESWGLIYEPISRENEADACTTMINGAEEALRGYPTRVEEDREVVDGTGLSLPKPGAAGGAAGGSAGAGAGDVVGASRRRLAARVRMGEKQALEEVLSYYSAVEARLDRTEYYQERRLRSLNLLDKDGNSTYDPFADTMA